MKFNPFLCQASQAKLGGLLAVIYALGKREGSLPLSEGMEGSVGTRIPGCTSLGLSRIKEAPSGWGKGLRERNSGEGSNLPQPGQSLAQLLGCSWGQAGGGEGRGVESQNCILGPLHDQDRVLPVRQGSGKGHGCNPSSFHTRFSIHDLI